MTRSQNQTTHYQNELLSSQSSLISSGSPITSVSPSFQPTRSNYPRDTHYPDMIQYHYDSGSSNSIFSFPPGSLVETPTTATTSTHFPNGASGHSVSDGYNITPVSGPLLWDDDNTDDELHNIDKSANDRKCVLFSRRGCLNVGALMLILGGMLSLMVVYPVYTTIVNNELLKKSGKNSTRIAGTLLDFVDIDTPESAHTKIASDGSIYKLVFSDEFNKDGRTFRPGDDLYWEAADLHYWLTNDLQWYSPDMVTTKDGKLQITITNEIIRGLNYKSGMLQSWNKFCFQGGILEVSVSLPGDGKTQGFWPSVWTLGNLGRPGYGATTDGVWPYSYDNCDVGITPNQSDTSGTFSYVPGQRLNKCTCPGQDHPSPGKGRGAPEIDVFEATIDGDGQNHISQSAQFAPFDANRMINKSFIYIDNPNVTTFNTYVGGVWQQAVSSLTTINNEIYNNRVYEKYAFEYEPGPDGYISWFVGDQLTWRMNASAVGPSKINDIGQRIISEEPMSIIINLGMSEEFSQVDFRNLEFPSTMYVDYVRVYQDPLKVKVSCDPPDHPTSDYIRK
ncbi:3304_t:CDS:2 [Cetraspora pellucida]|uniref:3304_t:CDS:1 n=1 Tax=Cetraspora pellucida TaxID=1433469 RepID=A0A9N9EJS2_9GLOM|nr:3304_t:CDS:2 [Cetraspora pellucida]